MKFNIWKISETDYTEEMPLGQGIERESLEALAAETGAEIVGNTLVCEWGNGEGQDVFGFEIVEPDQFNLTEIDSDLPVTEDEARAIYAEQTTDSTEWNYTVERVNDELRLYAERVNDNADDLDTVWQATPSRWSDWTMITNDYGYLIIGEIVS